MIEQLRDLVRRTRMMIGRCILAGVNDKAGIQEVFVRLLADESKDKIPHLQHYGFTAHPLPEAEAVTFFMSGNRDHGVVICIDDRRFRIKNLEPGEVAIYTDEDLLPGGNRIIFKRGQNIEIHTGERFFINVGEGKTYMEMTKAGIKIGTPDYEANPT